MASTSQTYSNAPSTTLANICNAGDTSITVQSSAGYPSTGPYTILIENEYMLVTSGFGTTTWGVTRAQEGTSAVSHAATTILYQVLTKAGLDSLNGGYWPFLQPSGLGNATQAGRWVGITVSGAPSSGTFAVGDMVFDQSGNFWVCINAGTPGVWLTRTPQQAQTSASQNTTSTTYVDLATVGPQVTVVTNTSVVVDLLAFMQEGAGGNAAYMSVAVSGATTLAAADSNSIQFIAYATNAYGQFGGRITLTGLTQGTNTFTAKFRTTAGTATFANRGMTVTTIN